MHSVQPIISDFSLSNMHTTTTVSDVVNRPEMTGARSFVRSMPPSCTWQITHNSWSSPFCPVIKLRNMTCSASDCACQLPVTSSS